MPNASSDAPDNQRFAYLRSQVPAMERTTYLNSGFIGPMSNQVAKAFRDHLDLEVAWGPTTRIVSEDRMANTKRLNALKWRLKKWWTKVFLSHPI